MTEGIQQQAQDSTIKTQGVEEQSYLPSETINISQDKWAITDDIKAKFKGEKLFDRFDSLEELVNGFSEMRTKHTNQSRDIAEGNKNSEAEIKNIKEQREASNLSQENLMKLSTELINSNMSVSDDLLKRVEDAGLSIDKVENQAYKSRDSINRAYDAVGGKDRYLEMQNWAKENVPEDIRNDFDKNLSTPSAHIYIKGLFAEFQEKTSTDSVNTETNIIRGDRPATVQTGGYETRAEMVRDVNFIQSGKASKSDLQRHRAKLGRTSDSIIFH